MIPMKTGIFINHIRRIMDVLILFHFRAYRRQLKAWKLACLS